MLKNHPYLQMNGSNDDDNVCVQNRSYVLLGLKSCENIEKKHWRSCVRKLNKTDVFRLL